ncbi:hypothetical protein V6615_01785 [Oscillospiraceae bacterium PP1C4]
MNNNFSKRLPALLLATALMVCIICVPVTGAEANIQSESTLTSSTTSMLAQTSSKPVEVSSKAVETSSKAVETSNKAATTSSKTDATNSNADATSSKPNDTSSKPNDTSSKPVDEKPKTDLTIIPSDANALVLMDVGAQSPKKAPGKIVNVVLPIAVNREYLPSEKYMLRNITITPDIPTDAKVADWPFDLINASYVRHLDDMSYNSTATVYYKFRISEFAKKGAYPINFKVNATVWREDAANGTSIKEDVTFKLCVYVTVTDDGEESGIVSDIGAIQLAGTGVGRKNEKVIESPIGSPNETITMKVPVVNKGGNLKDVTIAPVISASLDEFPFVAKNINYGKNFSSMRTGDTETLVYEFQISPFATSGNKPVKFHATYRENGIIGECNFYAYIYIKDGYKEFQPTAPSLMVRNYSLWVNDTEVKFLNAGEDAILKVQLINNAQSDTVYKNVAALTFADSKSIFLSVGSSDSSYIDSIAPGQTADVEYQISVRADAPVGPASVGVALNYETHDAVQGTAKQAIMLPVKQPMNFVIDEPVVYGNPVQGEPFSVDLNCVNMGRAKIFNLNVVAMEGISMAESYYGGDVPPAGTHSADIQLVSNKSGAFTGTLVVSYEDGNGEQYSQAIDLLMDVKDAVTATAAVQSDQIDQPDNHEGSSAVIVMIVLLVLAAAGTGAYWYFVLRRRKSNEDV